MASTSSLVERPAHQQNIGGDWAQTNGSSVEKEVMTEITSDTQPVVIVKEDGTISLDLNRMSVGLVYSAVVGDMTYLFVMDADGSIDIYGLE